MPGKTVIMTDTYSNWSNLLTYVIEETTRVDGKVLADLKARDELFIKLQVTDEFWNIKGAIYNVDKNVALEQLKKTSLILNPK